jgi:hypothetical protein
MEVAFSASGGAHVLQVGSAPVKVPEGDVLLHVRVVDPPKYPLAQVKVHDQPEPV